MNIACFHILKYMNFSRTAGDIYSYLCLCMDPGQHFPRALVIEIALLIPCHLNYSSITFNKVAAF